MWQAILDRMLRALVHRGALVVTYPDGRERRYGEEGAEPQRVRLLTDLAVRRLVVEPQLALGELYMDESLVIEGDELRAFLATVVRNADGDAGAAGWYRAYRVIKRVARRWGQVNRPRASRRNVQAHYDLPPALYDLFLDADRQYSCAYFRTPQDSLDEAQTQKKAHVARKLLLEPHIVSVNFRERFATLLHPVDQGEIGTDIGQASSDRRAKLFSGCRQRKFAAVNLLHNNL